jgi:branched-subunit amino acid ABC-type transport system permease component
MGLSALLAAIAGCLVGISYGVLTPYMGLSYTIKGLVAMIIGGVGSLRGAMMGALLIGVVEALAVTWLGSQSRDTTVFLILLATLLIRPAGLVRTAGMK